MDRLEKAEKVREKTGVTFEEAKVALEACDYDVLDAIVWLERHGRTASTSGYASYTTTGGAQDPTSAEMSAAQSDYEQATKSSGFSNAMNGVLDAIKRVLRKTVETSFVVDRGEKQLCSMPTLLLILLAVFAFWIVVPLLVIGLFFDFRYHFEGIGAVTVDINDLVDKAADGAETLKNDVMGSASDGYDQGRKA